MQVTLGDEGSGFSNPPEPRFLFPVGNIGEACPFLMLPLVLSLLLREVDSEVGGSRALPGLKIDVFIELLRELKQIKSSLVVVVVVVLVMNLCVEEEEAGSIKKNGDFKK